MIQTNFFARFFATSLLFASLLAGCKQAPELPALISPYRIDIQQGNVVTQEMVSKLKAGMTRAQVRFVLGSPLVVDPFRTDRWDYVSIYQKQGKDIERRRVTAIFEDDKLVRIEGDVRPADGLPAADKPPAGKQVTSPPAAPPAAEQGKVSPAPAPSAEVIKPPTASAVAPTAPNAATPAAAQTAADPKKDEAAKSDDAAKKDGTKDKSKPTGFFGRMLDKLGL